MIYTSKELRPILEREGFILKSSVLDTVSGIFSYYYKLNKRKEVLLERSSIAVVVECYHQSTEQNLNQLQLDCLLFYFTQEAELTDLLLTDRKFKLNNLEKRLKELKREFKQYDRFIDDKARHELIKTLSSNFYIIDHWREMPVSIR